jgi:thiamine biosynthesis protein ThiS
MKIMLNNLPEEFQDNTMTVAGLLKRKNFTFKMLVVKINNVLVPRNAYDQQIIRDGDDVVVLHLISGG